MAVTKYDETAEDIRLPVKNDDAAILDTLLQERADGATNEDLSEWYGSSALAILTAYDAQ